MVETGPAGALLLDPTGVKGLLMIDAMMFPICVVVAGWLTTGLVVGALVVPMFGDVAGGALLEASGAVDGGGGAEEPTPALEVGAVAAFFVVEGI